MIDKLRNYSKTSIFKKIEVDKMNHKNEKKKAKKQFWIAFALFMLIVGVLVLFFLILSTLNFFG